MSLRKRMKVYGPNTSTRWELRPRARAARSVTARITQIVGGRRWSLALVTKIQEREVGESND